MINFYLYKSVGFTKDDRVALIDDDANTIEVERILSLYTPISFNYSQLPRLNYSSGRLELNIELPEDYSIPRHGAYLKIEATNGSLGGVSYWFVDSIDRRAGNVAHLSLTMDVLNTFLPSFESSTYVNRTHRDRWQSSLVRGTIHSAAGLTLIPYVDPIGEGFVVNKYLTRKEEVPGDGNHWYLVYQTEKEPSDTGSNPVNCYLVPEEPVKSGSGSFLTESSAASHLGISNTFPHSIYLLTSDGNPWMVYGGDQAGNVYKSTDYAMAELYRASSSSSVTILLWRKAAGGWSHETANTALGLFAIDGKVHFGTGSASHGLNPDQIGGLSTGTLSTGGYLSNTIASVDRTDSTLVKIIECPYCPVTPSVNGTGEMSFVGWTYDQTKKYWKKDDLDATLYNAVAEVSIPGVEWVIDKPLTPFMDAFLDDPKLLHSDYHSFSAVYDSFVQSFPLEGFLGGDATQPAPSDLMKIGYKQSSAISSSLAFEFTPEKVALKQAGAFSTFLVSTRSNEKVIYTNNYLNYLRTGFNYDVKNKNLSVGATWGGFAASAAITLATVVSTIATSGATAPLAIAAGVSTAASLAGAIKSTASAEMSLDEKRESLQKQAASVAGANDLDLLRFYSNNKLWLVTMDPSDEVKEMLNAYFRYYGYAVNRQEAPKLNARSVYTFLQCSPKFTPSTREAFGSDDIEGLYAQALADGVTYIDVDYLSAGGFLAKGLDVLDKARSLENWEHEIYRQIRG